MNPIAKQYTSIERVTDQYLNQTNRTAAAQTTGLSFEEVLQRRQETGGAGLRFSRHASARLESRGITLSDEQSERLESGVMQAKEKGISESLVLVDSLAFIVNVPNQTVVTAMDQNDTTSNIFTNIDGAVIM